MENGHPYPPSSAPLVVIPGARFDDLLVCTAGHGEPTRSRTHGPSAGHSRLQGPGDPGHAAV